MDARLPVFLQPSNLTFYLKTESTHKQFVTLYNPYDFAIKYRVAGTARNKYSVIEPTGTILSRCYMDIIIKYNQPQLSNINVTDKFLIQIESINDDDDRNTSALGKRYISAILLDGEQCRDAATDDIRTFTSTDSSRRMTSDVATSTTSTSTQPHGGGISSRSIMIYSTMVLLIGTLFVPTSRDEEPQRAVVVNLSSWIPAEYHLTVSTKLICAYILGLITMAILRPC